MPKPIVPDPGSGQEVWVMLMTALMVVGLVVTFVWLGIKEAWKAARVSTKRPAFPRVGTRVRLTQAVPFSPSRPHFVAPVGATGTVKEHGYEAAEDCDWICVKLDRLCRDRKALYDCYENELIFAGTKHDERGCDQFWRSVEPINGRESRG